MFEVTQENCFDVAEALHWFCVNYHTGQKSILYYVQGRLGFTPSCMSHGPDSETSQEVYRELEAYSETHTPQEIDELAETLLSQIDSITFDR